MAVIAIIMVVIGLLLLLTSLGLTVYWFVLQLRKVRHNNLINPVATEEASP